LLDLDNDATAADGVDAAARDEDAVAGLHGDPVKEGSHGAVIESGGELVAAGTPEDIVRESRSHTGYFLKDLLARRPQGGKRQAAE
jgi:hypothetical protein